MLTLSQMHPGDQGIILGIHDQLCGYRQQLLAMGLTKGTPFTFLRRAPLGDPIEISVRGFHLCLRAAEACALTINPL